ncbi:Chaperonin CPN60-2, mitochondrial [Dendrobium catenatum]|uniref:Chaperonin CPN60-2, mitochondrial n=1 Tax=Dendrobium catenatum TaxID=906689 RepID=A0A2I0W816_9ASPA|nr:Chaperonin CPN60-2, mitochondrial [Dendrobium catenatum]
MTSEIFRRALSWKISHKFSVARIAPLHASSILMHKYPPKSPTCRNVIIEKNITKDGVTVAKSIEFKERAKNVGANLIKQVANATNKAAGDGTTCATVLTQAILAEGCKSVAAGVNVMDLRNGINMAVDSVLAHLKCRAWMISTSEEIHRWIVQDYKISYRMIQVNFSKISLKFKESNYDLISRSNRHGQSPDRPERYAKRLVIG